MARAIGRVGRRRALVAGSRVAERTGPASRGSPAARARPVDRRWCGYGAGRPRALSKPASAAHRFAPRCSDR